MVSLSEKPAKVKIGISDVANLQEEITLVDPIDDNNATIDLDAGSFGIELEPFGIRVARLNKNESD